MKRPLLFGLILGLAACAGAPGDDAAHAREIERWRSERLAELTTPDGWLTLIGLHFLPPGKSTLGSARDNDVVLAAGPAHLGAVTVGDDGRVRFDVAAGADVRIDGRPARTAELRADDVQPTLVTSGTVTFFAIERGGKKALRVKDSASERRTRFRGLEYFPIERAWRIEARWVPFERSRIMPITNIIGQTSPAIFPGKAVFEHDGRTFELLPIDEGPGKPLFFVIADATSGRETHGAARFIYAPPPEGDRIILDFNRAENPPCAFTPFGTCPLPPKENRLPFAVTAGEKVYRGPEQ